MNTSSDTRSHKGQDQLESGRAADPVPDATLLELGKVSDTRGGFFGFKLDTGFGVMIV